MEKKKRRRWIAGFLAVIMTITGVGIPLPFPSEASDIWPQKSTAPFYCLDGGKGWKKVDRYDMYKFDTMPSPLTETQAKRLFWAYPDNWSALKDAAKKIFRGTIDFKKGAAGAVGNEKEDVLLLDDDVVNQTIPLILCAEEDVEGNHGATIGKLDDDMVFYLESRGMELPKIYKMMAKARIDAVLRLVPDEKTKADVASYLESEATNGRI